MLARQSEAPIPTGHGGLQVLGHTLGGGVGAVSGTEGIVHVQVGVGSQLRGNGSD